jgi:hypothetical protein
MARAGPGVVIRWERVKKHDGTYCDFAGFRVVGDVQVVLEIGGIANVQQGTAGTDFSVPVLEISFVFEHEVPNFGRGGDGEAETPGGHSVDLMDLIEGDVIQGLGILRRELLCE